MPKKFFIPHPYPDEEIIIFLRRHWFVLILRLLFWAAVAGLPVVFYAAVGAAILPDQPGDALYPIFVLFVSAYYLYVTLFTFHAFVDYYLDVWIVTNRRIINIEQRGLFNREVSEQKLFRIQDVTAEVQGFFSTLLGYGTVFVQTAGERGRFHFKQVPEPYATAKRVILLADQDKRYHRVQGKTSSNLLAT